MSDDIIQTELAKLVLAPEEAAQELGKETELLRRTIAYNREDIYGMSRRVVTIQDRTERLGRIGAKIDGLHDLRYKILAGPVDRGEGSVVEEACPPTKPPPPPPSTRPLPGGRRKTPG